MHAAPSMEPELQNSLLVTVLLPSALAVIMMALGLSLTPADFARVVKAPRAVFVGLVCQVVLLPFACYLIVRGFGLTGALAVGLMLLSASPGGASANLFSHLARGDVALNITLTAVNSVVSLVTLPIILGLSLSAFMGSERAVPLEATKVLQVFAIVLVPVSIGMLVRSKRPDLAKRLDRPVRVVSVVCLLLIMAGALIKEHERLRMYFQKVGLAALVFNLVSLSVGYFVPRLFRVERKQAIAIGMEIGVHNGTLAIAIASSPLLLANATMAVPAAIYSVIMFCTAATFSWLMSRADSEVPDAADDQDENAAAA